MGSLLYCALSLMLLACGDVKHPHEAGLSKDVSDTRSRDSSIQSAEPIRSALPTGVVAQADRITITKRTLDHWIKVQAVLQYQLRPTRPVPRGVVPVPPLYRDCISYLATNAKAARPEKPANVAQLKSECAQQHEALLKHSMETLILDDWVKQESARAGIRLTSREYRAALRQQFPTDAGFHRFLTLTGLRASDERFLIEHDQLQDKWPRWTLPVYERLRHSKPPETMRMASEVDREVGKLTQKMVKRETPRTHCEVGYVVPVCSEYRK